MANNYILKGDLNYHLIREFLDNPREFLDNPSKLYNNSININLFQKKEYISINLIISKLMTLKKEKEKFYHISLYLSITFSFYSFFLFLFLYINVD